MMGLGWQELLIVLVIILIIFGAGKLPEVAKSLGRGVKEFKAEAAGEEPDPAVATGSAGKSTNEGRRIEPGKLRAEQI